MKEKPIISIIIAVHNRAAVIVRCINSVIRQTYPYFEIIIVDDKSTDNSIDLISRFRDDRIKIFKHENNRGALAAFNTGMDNISGDWFTLLGSDDEIVTEALEKLINIPLNVDKSITAVNCNCLDTLTNKFAGMGLDKTGYITVKQIANTEGEHWGITKTSLLGNDRFVEEFRSGHLGLLWNKIDERAKRYYLHEGLRIYHTEGDDRVTKDNKLRRNKNLNWLKKVSELYINQNHHWQFVYKYKRISFYKFSFKYYIILRHFNDERLSFYLNLIKSKSLLLFHFYRAFGSIKLLRNFITSNNL